MEKKLKIILGLVIVVFIFQLVFAAVLIKSTRSASGLPGEVSSMSREERLNLLESLWQAEDFKAADEETRRKAFESIVVE